MTVGDGIATAAVILGGVAAAVFIPEWRELIGAGLALLIVFRFIL